MPKPILHALDLKLTIHRLPPIADVPQIVLQGDFYSISRTADELTLICDSKLEIASERSESGWSAIQVAGPLDFSLTGILAGIASVLAQAEISIFAVSTYDTDYVLVRTDRFYHACHALEAHGYRFDPSFSQPS